MIWFIAGFVTGGIVGLVCTSVFAAAGNPDQYAEGYATGFQAGVNPHRHELRWDEDE